MNKLTLSQLQLLVAVVESGSFSAASVELGCTQSRISHAIAELESHVGARLLHRSRCGCVPTEVGQRVLVAARKILKLTKDIVSIETKDVELCGTVRIASIRSAATHLLPCVIESLAAEYPGIRLDILDQCHDYRSVTELVEQGAADIGITRGPLSTSLVSRPFVSDPYVVIAPAACKLSSPANANELAKLPFIHMGQPGSEWIVQKCQAAGLLQLPTRQLANESSILALVSRGLGYAVLPRLSVYPNGTATQILPLPFHACRGLMLFESATTFDSKLVETTRRYILNKRMIMNTDAWRAGFLSFDF